MNMNEEYPGVSVIVPVRNAEKTIEKLINALLEQDYPANRREIIIVDNDSNDRTVDIVKKYPVMLEQENRVRSSYAARNKGLSLAKGEIIAFTDADCIPERDWLSSGVQALLEKEADMAGGKISFILSDHSSASEIIDSVTFMQNEYNIKNKRTAVTANLFVHKELFKQVGFFAEAKSGEDFSWTQRATQRGFSLIYAEQAIIYHPARDLRELLDKGRRVGAGIIKNFLKNKSCFRKIYVVVRQLIPVPSRNVLKFIITDRKDKNYFKCVLAIWVVSYLLHINQFAGMISLIFKSRGK